MTDPPLLSVILTSTAPLRTTPAGLTAIAAQCRGRRAEILLACSADATGAVSGQPGVTLLRLPEDANLPRLLGAALPRASGSILAITDVTCGIDDRWVASILEAHESPHPVIGGAVEPGDLRSLVDWAAYFCDYGQFMLPLRAGPAAEMPGNNLSIKRSALATGREFVEGEFWKTYWCRQVQAAGHALHAAPSIVVSYNKSFRLGPYLAHRFHGGRCFAGMRIARAPAARRAAYAAGSPLLPLLFCARILRAVVPKGRHLGRLLLSLPIVLPATIAWALGELAGYLRGPGTSCRHVR
jgi:hypothetical protein